MDDGIFKRLQLNLYTVFYDECLAESSGSFRLWYIAAIVMVNVMVFVLYYHVL